MGAEVVIVARVGRNQPCACGSGRKVKRCCGQDRGPSPDDLAWCVLRDHARSFARLLRHYDEAELEILLEGAVELPVRHLSLQVELPRILPPELEWLRTLVDEGADDLVDAVQRATAAIDGPLARLRLAAEAARLCRDDDVDLECVAIIMADLARPTSLFMSASLIAAIAVSLGRCPTPAGLLVAAG